MLAKFGEQNKAVGAPKVQSEGVPVEANATFCDGQKVAKKPPGVAIPPDPQNACDGETASSERILVKAEAKREDKPLPDKKGFAGFWARVKKIKNIEIYLAIAMILVMVAIYMTTLGGGVTNAGATQRRRNEDAYAREMEAKLTRTLGQIRGAGRVEVMVTVVGSATLEVAYNIDEKTVTQSGGGGSATTTTTIVKTPVIVHGKDGPQPLILLEIKPKIRGVVVVASGAFDVGVRMQLLRAVQTVIADDSVRIDIFTGK